jgi:hypothetical protein
MPGMAIPLAVAGEARRRRAGGPLAMLGLIVALWVGGRVVLWEDPLGQGGLIGATAPTLAAASPPEAPAAPVLSASFAAPPGLPSWPVLPRASSGSDYPVGGGLMAAMPGMGRELARHAQGHHVLWRSATMGDVSRAWLARGGDRADPTVPPRADTPFFPGLPPFALRPREGEGSAAGHADRWSLGAWAFVREGSGSAPISQGRVPVYGASQIGASLQYRIAPSLAQDARAYVRAYRALIERPESELAAGLSARPMRDVPVRLAAEVRATENRFGSDVRPAAYGVTEIAPVALPLGLVGEVYAGAGYVGGDADTAFVDGQAVVTREIASFDIARADDVRVSLGAGAWGGAQRDANRIDVGPTMRIDLDLGEVPARLSFDYRERVGGDAAPVSGLAATLSTQF